MSQVTNVFLAQFCSGFSVHHLGKVTKTCWDTEGQNKAFGITLLGVSAEGTATLRQCCYAVIYARNPLQLQYCCGHVHQLGMTNQILQSFISALKQRWYWKCFLSAVWVTCPSYRQWSPVGARKWNFCVPSPTFEKWAHLNSACLRTKMFWIWFIWFQYLQHCHACPDVL